MRLHQHHLKINLDKCLFGNQQVSYLGFTLTPEGIKPGEAKLKAIKNMAPPKDIKGIRSFMRLCNFFRHHIQDFAIIAPLCLNSRGKIQATNLDLFQTPLWRHSRHSKPNCCLPALAFPRTDWKYLLITEAHLPDQDSPGGLCANLA